MQSTVGQETIRLIKEIVLEEAEKLGVRVEKIILFGSRARGDHREESDYDILIVVERRLSWKEFSRFQSRVRVSLFRLLGREIDLIVVDKEWFEERREVWGTLEHIAMTEGVIV